MSLFVDVWPKHLNVWWERAVCHRSEKRTALNSWLVPVICLPLCLSGRVCCYFKAGRSFLSSGVSSHLFSLACQGTLHLWQCPFNKLTSFAVKSRCLKTSYIKMDFSLPETGSSVCSLSYWVDCFNVAPKLQGWKNVCKPSQGGNAKKSEHTVFLPPLSVCWS